MKDGIYSSIHTNYARDLLERCKITKCGANVSCLCVQTFNNNKYTQKSEENNNYMVSVLFYQFKGGVILWWWPWQKILTFLSAGLLKTVLKTYPVNVLSQKYPSLTHTSVYTPATGDLLLSLFCLHSTCLVYHLVSLHWCQRKRKYTLRQFCASWFPICC